MNNNPLVSIIMTVYNTELYLKEAVNSILNQSLKDFEFIIIDDGSTDGSAQLLDSFSDSRIRIFKSTENLGLIVQSNRALELAKGKYIARMDSDDISLPDRLSTQVEFLEANNQIGLCGTFLKYFDERKSYTKSILPVSHDSIGTFYAFGNSVVHATVMFRKSILDEFKIKYPTDVRAGGDIAFLSSLYEHTQFVNIPEVFFKCRIRKTSVSRTHNKVQTDIGSQVKLKFLEKLLVNLSASEREKLKLKHLELLSAKIDSMNVLKELMCWIGFLINQNRMNRVFKDSEFNAGVGHFVYRQLVRDQACTLSNLLFLTRNYVHVIQSWPQVYKAIFVARSFINLFRYFKV